MSFNLHDLENVLKVREMAIAAAQQTTVVQYKGTTPAAQQVQIEVLVVGVVIDNDVDAAETVLRRWGAPHGLEVLAKASVDEGQVKYTMLGDVELAQVVSP